MELRMHVYRARRASTPSFCSHKAMLGLVNTVHHFCNVIIWHYFAVGMLLNKCCCFWMGDDNSSLVRSKNTLLLNRMKFHATLLAVFIKLLNCFDLFAHFQKYCLKMKKHTTVQRSGFATTPFPHELFECVNGLGFFCYTHTPTRISIIKRTDPNTAFHVRFVFNLDQVTIQKSEPVDRSTGRQNEFCVRLSRYFALKSAVIVLFIAWIRTLTRANAPNAYAN